MNTVEPEGSIQEGCIRGFGGVELGKEVVAAVGHCRGPRLVSAPTPAPFLTIHSFVDHLLPLVWISQGWNEIILHQPE